LSKALYSLNRFVTPFTSMTQSIFFSHLLCKIEIFSSYACQRQNGADTDTSYKHPVHISEGRAVSVSLPSVIRQIHPKRRREIVSQIKPCQTDDQQRRQACSHADRSPDALFYQKIQRKINHPDQHRIQPHSRECQKH